MLRPAFFILTTWMFVVYSFQLMVDREHKVWYYAKEADLATTWTNIKFDVHFDPQANFSDHTSPAMIRRAVNQATEYFTNAVSVRSLRNGFYVMCDGCSETVCGAYKLPREFECSCEGRANRTLFKRADVILLVTTHPDGGNVESSWCQADGRPTIIVLSFDRQIMRSFNIEMPNNDKERSLRAQTLRQLARQLFFSDDLMDHFPNQHHSFNLHQNTLLNTPWKYKGQQSVNALTLSYQPFLGWAREYLKCDELRAIPLDVDLYMNSSQRILAFERRFFPYELMQTDFVKGGYQVLSYISMSLMESSGWYRVNYSALDPMPDLLKMQSNPCKYARRCSAWRIHQDAFMHCPDNRNIFVGLNRREKTKKDGACNNRMAVPCPVIRGEQTQCIDQVRLPRVCTDTTERCTVLETSSCATIRCRNETFEVLVNNRTFECGKDSDEVFEVTGNFGGNSHWHPFLIAHGYELMAINEKYPSGYRVKQQLRCPRFCSVCPADASCIAQKRRRWKPKGNDSSRVYKAATDRPHILIEVNLLCLLWLASIWCRRLHTPFEVKASLNRGFVSIFAVVTIIFVLNCDFDIHGKENE